MDACVEIKTLQHEKEFMEAEIRRLENVINLIEEKENRASVDLEGNQFDIASEEISFLERTIENTILHLKLLINHLEVLINHVNEYTNSCYGGD